MLATTACKGGERANARASVPRVAGPAAAIMDSAGEIVIPVPATSYIGAAVANAGTVTGTVTLTGTLTPAPPASTGRDSTVCGATVADSSVQQRGPGLGGVVVWLDGVRRGKPIPLERRIEVESDHCLLTPRVQATVTNSAVNVVGHDDFRQHLHFVAAGEAAPRATVLLGKDEQVIPTELPAKKPGMVIVRDSDHSWPSAYVAVFDHPYFAVTKPDGSFTIDGVPAGRYTVVTWHERAKKSEQKIEVGANLVAKIALAVQSR